MFVFSSLYTKKKKKKKKKGVYILLKLVKQLYLRQILVEHQRVRIHKCVHNRVIVIAHYLISFLFLSNKKWVGSTFYFDFGIMY